jgi:hypothetical protein
MTESGIIVVDPELLGRSDPDLESSRLIVRDPKPDPTLLS